MPVQMLPLVVNVPTQIGNGLVRISMGTELRVFEVSANLFALTTGPHTIRVRRAADNSVMGQVTFNSAGVQIFTGIDEYIADNDGMLFDCTALGVGALHCTVCIWGIVPQSV